MTALVADFGFSSAESVAAIRTPIGLQRADPEPGAPIDVVCNRHLWLHVALLAPLSAGLWIGLGWAGYQLMTSALG